MVIDVNSRFTVGPVSQYIQIPNWCGPETNIMLCVNFMPIKKIKKRAHALGQVILNLNLLMHEIGKASVSQGPLQS